MSRKASILHHSRELAAEIQPVSCVVARSRSTGDIDLDQLSFGTLPLYGRDQELSELLEAYENAIAKGKTNIVFLSGYTGVGKSAIVKQFQKSIDRMDICREQRSLCASGKFDLHARVEPYSAFVSAFTELCHVVLSFKTNNEDRFQRMKQCIKDYVGLEAALLSYIIPNLHEILEIPETSVGFSDSEEFGSSRGKNRFNFILRQFVRAVCEFCPLVLFLDDLQWADAASLELLELLVTDSELRNLLLLGCYRSNEVPDTHRLRRTIQDLHKFNSNAKEESQIKIKTIEVSNLDVSAVHDLVTDVLRSDATKTHKLSVIVHEKTLGNVFFAVQFLKMLKDENLLTFNLGTLSWSWDDENIRTSTTVADNVADIVRNKISRLPAKVTRLLQLASCLGSTFAASTIGLVSSSLLETDDIGWKCDTIEDEAQRLNGTSLVKDTLEECLSICVQQGLLEVNSSQDANENVYDFVHDQIQAAAYSLIPENVRMLLQVQIGEVLVDSQSSEAVNKVLFIAVDMLNNGSSLISDQEKKIALARLNLRAGKRAMESSAFVSASTYLSRGIDLMGANHWEAQYELSLDFFNLIIKADYCIGRFEEVYEKIDQVLMQKDKPISDKVEVYTSFVEALGAQGRIQDAIKTSLKILSQLGAHFNLKMAIISTISELMKTRRLLKGRPLLTLSDLPMMKDKCKIKAMRIMNRCCTYAYAAAPDLLPLLIFKMMQWSIQYGVCRHSTTAFALYGLPLVSLFGDQKSAHEIGKVALTLSDKLEARETRSATVAYVNACLNHWVAPLHDSRNQFLSGYQVGLHTGDIENAMLCAMNYCHACFETGKPLTEVEKDLRAFTAQMVEYKQTLILNVALVIWQAVLNLLGQSDDPTVLTGEAMNQVEMLKHCDSTGNLQHRDGVRAVQIELVFMFGDYERAAKIALDLRKLAATNPATYVLWRFALFEGLTFFAMARKTRFKPKWRKRASATMRKVRNWVSKGNVNCVHIYQLLEAEAFALAGKTDKAKKQYDLSIATAARNGFPRDRALANERAGEMFIEAGDKLRAADYLQLAYDLYVDWEAVKKAEHLWSKHPLMISQDRRQPLSPQSLVFDVSLSSESRAVDAF